MREKRFLTYPLLVHLSDRDLTQLVEVMDRGVIIKACADLDSDTTKKILKQFTDPEYIFKEAEKLKDLPKSEIIQAKDQIAALADQLLVNQEFEDFSIWYAS